MSEIEKACWELEATEVFIDWYRKTYHVAGSIVRQNKPAKPDITCKLSGQLIDIEIAHLYGSEKEAMAILGRKLDKHTREELIQLEQNGNVESRLLFALNRILSQKASKHYKGTRIWLVIRNAHPAWACTDIEGHLSALEVPFEHPFEKIWIIGDLLATSGAIQIYPLDS